MNETRTFMIGLGLGALLFGMLAWETAQTNFNPSNFVDKPYCESAHIKEKEFKRCWKVTEVEP